MTVIPIPTNYVQVASRRCYIDGDGNNRIFFHELSSSPINQRKNGYILGEKSLDRRDDKI